ncbi:Putative glycosyltransferase EpsH [Rosistilla oblonga]|nr:Putative glycosyltransferase EpsH [Rosistilla oblonga]
MRSDSVSVVIPCYNGESFIEETLRSVLGQTHKPTEIWVIDDGSTDASAEVAASVDDRVQVVRQENAGEAVARNHGIRLSTGDWIAFCDADDLWEPGKLERQLQGLAKDDALASCTGFFNFGDISDVHAPDGLQGYFSIEDVIRGIPSNMSTFLIRSECCPRFREGVSYGEDTLFFLDVVLRGALLYVSEPLVGYRRHAAGQSRFKATQLYRYLAKREWITRHAPSLGEDRAASCHFLNDNVFTCILDAAYYSRRMDHYVSLSRACRKETLPRSVESAASRVVLPGFVFRLYDRVMGMIGR